MKTMVIWKKPHIDLSYTGEWSLKRESWADTHQFTEYYFGPFLFRIFDEMAAHSNDLG